jgi:hypothetical protein
MRPLTKAPAKKGASTGGRTFRIRYGVNGRTVIGEIHLHLDDGAVGVAGKRLLERIQLAMDFLADERKCDAEVKEIHGLKFVRSIGTP